MLYDSGRESGMESASLATAGRNTMSVLELPDAFNLSNAEETLFTDTLAS